MYTVNKLSVDTYDAATGEKIIEKSVECKTWNEVKKTVYSGDWFYGGGFNVEHNGEYIGDNDTFRYCENNEQPAKITLREFKESQEMAV